MEKEIIEMYDLQLVCKAEKKWSNSFCSHRQREWQIRDRVSQMRITHKFQMSKDVISSNGSIKRLPPVKLNGALKSL